MLVVDSIKSRRNTGRIRICFSPFTGLACRKYGPRNTLVTCLGSGKNRSCNVWVWLRLFLLPLMGIDQTHTRVLNSAGPTLVKIDLTNSRANMTAANLTWCKCDSVKKGYIAHILSIGYL